MPDTAHLGGALEARGKPSRPTDHSDRSKPQVKPGNDGEPACKRADAGAVFVGAGHEMKTASDLQLRRVQRWRIATQNDRLRATSRGPLAACNFVSPTAPDRQSSHR